MTTLKTGSGLAHRDDYYETPDWLFDDIVKETGLKFDIDLCADDDNTKCMCYIDEEMDILSRIDDIHWRYHMIRDALFCNPPRSKNGKFVDFIYDILWKKWNFNIVMLLCWNDLGNKYGERLLPHIMNGEIMVKNLGKVKFCKKGVESEFPSRLTYFWAWFKSKP